MNLVERAPRNLFFTGKGGVGKTSVACATALALSELGRRVLLVSTDPASNLDEVLETPLGSSPTEVRGSALLLALNVDPEAAARTYRERLVGPYRGVLPEAAIRSIEEQLSGACTVEIAAFDEFSKLLGDPKATETFDHVVFDTAPTGHTLRLLELPAAWENFLAASAGGSSCLGPLSGLKEQQALYEATRRALSDAKHTAVLLVARPEPAALTEAARASRELGELGVERQELIVNGLLGDVDLRDPTARAMSTRERAALDDMPAALAKLPRTEVPLRGYDLTGLSALRALFAGGATVGATISTEPPPEVPQLSALLSELGGRESGLILTMGKGGVGKTTVALRIASALADRGRKVHLTTTDPAGSFGTQPSRSCLRVTRIDPRAETRAYVEEAMRTAGGALDEAGRALLEEDLRSPCTEEVAVFRAFARVVHEAREEIVVVDTAPTGHTLLLLDAAEAYHREVLRTAGGAPEEVRLLLPRLRDPGFTRILLVTLAESTSVHEAAALQADLARAGIRPFGWVINQSLEPLAVSEPLLQQRRARQGRYLREVLNLAPRTYLVPWGVEDGWVQAAPPQSTLRAQEKVAT